MDARTREAARLWTTAMPTVSAFVTSLVRDFQARDDVLQDIAVAVIESFDSYDSSRPFIGWVIGVARNQVRHYYRRKAHERMIFDSEAVDVLSAAFAETSTEQSQLFGRLGKCIEELDEHSRRLCQLRYERDLKPAAIGPIVGMGANAVAKALQRIRDRLKHCIERNAAIQGG